MLCQGWFPDGLYAAPNDEALVSDLKVRAREKRGSEGQKVRRDLAKAVKERRRGGVQARAKRYKSEMLERPKG